MNVKTWHCLRCEVIWAGERVCWVCHRDLATVSQDVAVSLVQQRVTTLDALERGKIV